MHGRPGPWLSCCANILVAVAACSTPDRVPLPRDVIPPAHVEPALPVAPGLRLPDDVTPLAYDLTLDVDPDRETFAGEVRVRVRLERATDHVWIHADQLDITSARYSGGALTQLPVTGDQMRVFGFGRVLPPGEVELAFAYTGRTTGDQEGLFRQQTGGRWYLFSQGESVFARRIAPCFDEPQFKTPWRVTLVVPRDDIALANGAEESVTVEGDRQRVRFAATEPIPSYLVAIAVGPFDLVDAGTVGEQRIAVRVAVHAGAAKQVHVVASRLPAIVAALETYIGEPLPLRKLDLVGVPAFFGAMENPGLITFDEGMLVGRDSKDRVDYFTHIAAHELAHQWFGNAVTPAWWDDLWLSESFASWLGDKVTRRLGGFGDGALRDVLERREALAADAGPEAIPLHRPIAVNTDPDDAFDAIAYQKGESVLATFEAFAGEDAFRAAVRDYLRAHRGGSATARDWIDALAGATTTEAGKAFEQYTLRVGAPVVDLSLHCAGTPAVLASARDQRFVPVCVRYPGARGPACALVGAQTEIAVGATCPAWVDGNAAAGYYTVHWRDRPATSWLRRLPATARAIAGDDLGAALERGELSAEDALVALHALLAGDDYGRVGAAALAQQVDEIVDDATRPAWTSWLARELPKVGRTHGPGQAALVALRRRLPVDRAPAAEQRRARALLDQALRLDGVVEPVAVALAAVKGGDDVFDAIVTRARHAGSGDTRDRWLALLGELPPAYAERVAGLVSTRELPVAPLWHAIARYLARPEARTAGWHALRVHLATFVERTPDRGDEMIDAVGGLCDRAARDEVAQAFTPHLARIRGGRVHLDRALASIDRCVARRAAFGDLGAVLESAHTHSPGPCARRGLGARCRDEHR